MFNVNYFVVSQANPYVLPLLGARRRPAPPPPPPPPPRGTAAAAAAAPECMPAQPGVLGSAGLPRPARLSKEA